jgi:predicted transcriptional regulator
MVSRDYKKIRILNFLSDNHEYFLKYTICNLPSSTGTNYRDGAQILKDLMDDGLVELKREPKSKSYKITQKGREFMEDFKRVRHLDTIVRIDICNALREPTKTDWL